ncbi:MAG: transglutaminase domain-containing protein [Candidatus Omnitrophota bacterium]
MKSKLLKRILIFSGAAMLVLFLASPFLSLLMPKLAAHSYSALTFWVIVDKEVGGAFTAEEKTLKLFGYVRENIMLPSGSRPYEGRPLDYLINEVGWCDYMSRVFDCLLAAGGVPARYAMLMDKECSLSNHTLNEVFIHGKWAVFDPLTGVIFRDQLGRYLSLQEISDHPAFISANYRLSALERFTGVSSSYYSDKFPLSCQPRRSEVSLKDLTIFDYLTMGYARLFRDKFSSLYQDAYLFLKTKAFVPDYNLFYRARNYQLYYRSDLAKQHYNALIEEYPHSQYLQDSIFFLSLLYINQDGNNKAGIDLLEALLLKYPDTKWVAYVNFYLAKAYDKIGNTSQASADYLKAAQDELGVEVIYRLTREKEESKI